MSEWIAERLAERERLGHIPLPHLFERAGNLAKAGGRVAKAIVTRKKVRVSKEEKERRLAICHACEWFQANTCMKCGCVAKWKTKLATEHCPDIPPRW